MKQQKTLNDQSLSEVHESVNTFQQGNRWKRFLAFFGPAYLVSVGYMDPGNWATDLAGGSQYGYSLIWVLLMSNLMAQLLQSHAARLGIVRGRDLAQANRETYPRPVNFMLYLLAEIAIAATDLAEVLGMAIGIHLLTGIPLLWGVAITVLDTFLLLYLQKLGIRKMEAFIIALVAIIGFCFLINIIIAAPSFTEIAGGFVPSLPDAADLYKKEGILSPLPGNSALYLAVGIIGATIMPHNLYLHSALVQTRKFQKTEKGIKQAIRFNLLDTTIALNLAFFVNAAILILAATTFFKTNNTHVAEIGEAHRLLASFLGTGVAPVLFAVALIAAGQSSTITGTLAGQIVMEGYLKLRINPWIRRLLTRLVAIIPAILVILISGSKNVDGLLILSQVILSMQLGFAIIPLIHFVSNRQTMGRFVIKKYVAVLSWLVASILIFLNIRMLLDELVPIFTNGHLLMQLLLLLFAALFLFLLLYTIIYPVFKPRARDVSLLMHHQPGMIQHLKAPVYNHIAVALDFSAKDEKIIASALGQGHEGSHYHLVHVVESAAAKIMGDESEDLETLKDREQIALYAKQLNERGIQTTAYLGYRNRTKEIVRIVKETGADLLVIGSHGHSGIKDWWYGETVNSVRHEIKIPVLVVSL
jgi:manganese transport protein